MLPISANRLPYVILYGSLWGVSECLLGIYLRRCASLTSGSIMTGVAVFFLAAGWSLSRTRLAIPLMIILASLFKMFDALFLSLPLQHGAVANPIFAFLLEGLAIWLVITFISDTWHQKIIGQAMAGIFSALLAVNLFPLVKYVTGIPACVVPGTNFPLSLYYAPLAISLSALAFPLGRLTSQALDLLMEKPGLRPLIPWFNRLFAPAVFLIGLFIVAASHGSLKF